MSCATHLVECLINKGISPKAYASSEFGSSYVAQYGISYTTSNYFHTKRENKPQWWLVDFTEPVAIDSYQIGSGSGCNYITKWTASVSTDFNTWIKVDEKDELSPAQGKIYKLNKTSNARYFKIDGSTPRCTDYDPTSFGFHYIKFFGSFNLVKPQRTKDACATRYRRDTCINRKFLLIN